MMTAHRGFRQPLRDFRNSARRFLGQFFGPFDASGGSPGHVGLEGVALTARPTYPWGRVPTAGFLPPGSLAVIPAHPHSRKEYPRVASNQSKTARASVRAGANAASGGALNVLGEFKYVIPLNRGKHAYVRNLTTGKTVHCATDSEIFVNEIKALAEAGHGTKIRSELNALAEIHPDHGWELTAKRLVEAGVFAS